MKHVKTFEQYDGKDILNEGIIDTILGYSGKLKDYFAKKLQNLEPGKLEELKNALAPYMGKSFNEVRAMIQPKLQPALEKKINEYSEPRSSSWGMPAVNAPEIINPFSFVAKLGIGTLAATFLTGGINWVITHWPTILGGAGGGISEKGLGVVAMVGLISLGVTILTGVIGSLDD